MGKYSVDPSEITLWHHRLAQASYSTIESVKRLQTTMDYAPNVHHGPITQCLSCPHSKQTQAPFQKPQTYQTTLATSLYQMCVAPTPQNTAALLKGTTGCSKREYSPYSMMQTYPGKKFGSLYYTQSTSSKTVYSTINLTCPHIKPSGRRNPASTGYIPMAANAWPLSLRSSDAKDITTQSKGFL